MFAIGVDGKLKSGLEWPKSMQTHHTIITKIATVVINTNHDYISDVLLVCGLTGFPLYTIMNVVSFRLTDTSSYIKYAVANVPVPGLEFKRYSTGKSI